MTTVGVMGRMANNIRPELKHDNKLIRPIPFTIEKPIEDCPNGCTYNTKTKQQAEKNRKCFDDSDERFHFNCSLLLLIIV